MLVLCLKEGEKIILDNGITVTLALIQKTKGRAPQVRLGIDAPKDMVIVRGEILEEQQRVIEQSKKNLATWSKKPLGP